MGDRFEMVVQVHCGTVLGDEFPAMLKMRLPKQSHNSLGQPSSPLNPPGGGGEETLSPTPASHGLRGWRCEVIYPVDSAIQRLNNRDKILRKSC